MIKAQEPARIQLAGTLRQVTGLWIDGYSDAIATTVTSRIRGGIPGTQQTGG